MGISVAVPVCRPDKKLFRSIKRLLKQTIVPEEILLYLTLSADYGCRELKSQLEQYGIVSPCIKILEVLPENFNHGGTRQLAAERCISEYILFMTQDAVPADKHLLENLLEGFMNAPYGQRAAVCYGRQLANSNALTVERFSREYNYPDKDSYKTKKELEAGSIKAIFCSDVCAMYDCNIFDKLGGFETDVNFNEDMLYAHKALSNDFCIGYCSGARVFHSHNLSLREQFWRNFEIAKSQKAFPEVFGRLDSEGEGLKYVSKGLKYIEKNGNFFEGIYFVFYCGIRYLGFLCGKILGKKK